MSSVTLERTRRVQLGLLSGLLALAALAWLITRERMLGMDAGPGTDPGGLGFYVISWVVMMSAMMFPSIAPMVLTFDFVQKRRHMHAAVANAVSSWIFIAGYLLTWMAFGVLAYGVFVGVRSLSIPVFSWHRGGRYLAGGVLLAAAAYQLTPAKDACLSRCRAPLDFVLHNWRDGAAGAVRMGIVHGAWCVGCCWALMASLFALGLMSIPWMIGVALLIAIEKLLPRKRVANLLVAATLAALALGVALSPANVPWLTLPDSSTAARAMRSMRMGGSKAPMRSSMPTGGSKAPMRSSMPTGGSKAPMRSSMPMGGSSKRGAASQMGMER